MPKLRLSASGFGLQGFAGKLPLLLRLLFLLLLLELLLPLLLSLLQALWFKAQVADSDYRTPKT